MKPFHHRTLSASLIGALVCLCSSHAIAQSSASGADPVLSPDAVKPDKALSPEDTYSAPVRSPDYIRPDRARSPEETEASPVLSPDAVRPEPARSPD